MTDRREFVGAVLALGGGMLGGTLGRGQVRVEAHPSVFHAPPDARRVLVRFIAHGAEQPAGRLRVFDARNQLLGTAGMLGIGDDLRGELWLPLPAETRVRSELEMPGTQRPITTHHTLRVPPRWTIHWLTLANPDGLAHYTSRHTLLALPAAAAVLRHAGVSANPVRALPPPEADHMSLLGIGAEARALAVQNGVPLGPVAAFDRDAVLSPPLATALAGSGIRVVVRRGDGGVWRLQGSDGTAILIAEHDAPDPGSIGFGTGRAALARSLERYLEGVATASARPEPRTLVIVGTDPGLALASIDALEEWHGHYAYPRIVVGDGEALEQSLTAAPAITPPPPSLRVPDMNVQSARLAPARPAGTDLFIPVARALSPEDPTLGGIANGMALPVPGVVVFNPSPFSQSDVVAIPDGTEQLVTSVPSTGYAWVPAGRGGGIWSSDEAGGGGHEIRGGAVAVTLDAWNGAINSVRTTQGREWVTSGGAWNAISGTRLEETRRERLDGVGERIIARRGLVTTTVTVYDNLPWIDVVNVAEDAANAVFGVNMAVDEVRWEVAGGTDRGTPPIAHLSHLRWISLEGGGESILLGSMHAPHAAVSAEGRFTSFAPVGAVRYRIAVPQPGRDPHDPWRFGWSLEPMVAVPTAGRGAIRAPTFGSIFSVDHAGVLIVGVVYSGVRRIIVYLQETLGVRRTVVLSVNLLNVVAARLVDLAGRDLGPAGMPGGRNVEVELRGYGFGAVQLEIDA